MSVKNGNGNIELTPKLLVAVITAALMLGSAGAWGVSYVPAFAKAPDHSVREEILVLAGTVDNLQNVVEYNYRETERNREKLDEIQKLLVQNRIAIAELKARVGN